MDKKKPSYEELLEEIKRLQERLTYDPITGLYRTQEEGRKKILLAIQNAHKKRKKVGLIRLDLNNLKSWNKKFGHEETDELLGQMGKKLNKWAWQRNGIAMRFHYKGDEFGVLVPAESKEELKKISRKLVGFKMKALDKESLVCDFTLGIAHEEEPEVEDELAKQEKKGNSLTEEGRLFTALNLVADSRERKEKSG